MAYTDPPFYLTDFSGQGSSGSNPDRIRTTGQGSGTSNQNLGVADWGTNQTNRWILIHPHLTNTASATPAFDGTRCWNILFSDMNVSDARRYSINLRRLFFRGNFTQVTPDVGFNYQLRLIFARWRSVSDWDLIGEVDSISFSAAVSLQGFTSPNNMTLLNDIEFDTDESLAMSLWIRGQGQSVTGRSLQVQGNVSPSFGSPGTYFEDDGEAISGLRSIYEEHNLSIDGIGVASLGTKKISKSIFPSAVGDPSFVRELDAFRTFSPQAVGEPAVPTKKITKVPFESLGVGTVQSERTIKKATFTSTGVGTGSIVRKTVYKAPISAIGVGVAQFSRRLDAFRAFTGDAIGEASFVRVGEFVRLFTATGKAEVTVFAKIDIELIPSSEGGGGGNPQTNGCAATGGSGGLSSSGRVVAHGSTAAGGTAGLNVTGYIAAPSVSGQSAIGGSGGLASIGYVRVNGSSVIGGKGGLIAAGHTVSENEHGCAAVGGEGGLAPSGYVRSKGNSKVGGQGGLAVAGYVSAGRVQGHCSMGGAGGLASAGRVVVGGTSAIGGSAGLTASGHIDGPAIHGFSTVGGAGGLVAAGRVRVSGSSVLGGSGGLVAAGDDSRISVLVPVDSIQAEIDLGIEATIRSEVDSTVDDSEISAVAKDLDSEVDFGTESEVD